MLRSLDFLICQVGLEVISILKNLSLGLRNTGMDAALVSKVMGGNWFKFFSESFEPKI